MQISKATRSPFLSNEILAMPPRFKHESYFENNNLSPIGTKGAPCPFNATSKLRRSQTVVVFVVAAIVAPQPICVLYPNFG